MLNNTQSHKSENIALIVTITAIFIMYVLTIREGHNWGGDFALYLKHALNLLDGRTYSDTGYIVNPAEPWISPATYPPVFPALLALFIKFFGFSLFYIKIYLILIFCLTLLIFHRILLDKVNTPSNRILIILISGASPWFVEIKDHILSEFPFMLFMFFYLFLTEIYIRKHDEYSLGKKLLYGVFIGLIGYLAYGCRGAGIVLIPAFFLSFIIYRRKIDTGLVAAIIVFSCFYLLQNQFLSTYDSYSNIEIEQSSQSSEPGLNLLERIHFNTFYYIKVVNRYWDNDFSIYFRILTIVVTSFLTFLGFYSLIRKPNSTEIISISYIFLLLIVPFLQDNRYLLPVIPLYIMYIFRGLESLTTGHLNNKPVLAQAALVVIIGISYAGNFSTHNFDTFKYGVETSTSKEMFQYIKNKTDENAIIIFLKPRILALYTDRKSMAYSTDIALEAQWKYIRKIKAGYLLTIDTRNLKDYKNYKDLIMIKKDELSLVFSNRNFKLYRILQDK